MPNYYADVADGVTIFTGFVGTTPTRTSTCAKMTAASAPNTTATGTKKANIKMRMLPQGTKATNTMFVCGSTYRISPKGLNTASVWYTAASLAIPTAYTQSMSVAGGTVRLLYKRLGNLKFWIDAFNSTGTRVASTAAGTVAVTATNTSVFTNFVIPTTKAVTVPINGYAVLRIACQKNVKKTSVRIMVGDTARVNGTTGTGPVSLQWNPTETVAGAGATITGIAATVSVGSVVASIAYGTITHTFRNEADSAAWANGINVVAYVASTLSNANPTVAGNAVIAGGAGQVVITVYQPGDVVLVPDHLNVSAPIGEQGISEALTPV